MCALFGHTEIPHTLIEMGSAALAAAVPYSGEATRISRKGTMKHTLPTNQKEEEDDDDDDADADDDDQEEEEAEDIVKEEGSTAAI